MDEFHDLEIDRRHVVLLLDEYSPPDEGCATIWRRIEGCH